MSGHIRGVAARLQQCEPNAIFVHCLVHSTNLWLQLLARQSLCIRGALDLVMELSQLIRFSPKKSSLFKAMQAQMSPGSPLLKPFCPTCWTVRTKAIAAVLENYGLLLNDIGKRWVCTKINWPFKFYEEIQHILWFKAFLSYFLSYWTTFCHIVGQRHNYTGGCTSI